MVPTASLLSGFVLQPAHGYVALAVVFTALVHNFYMSFGVGMARKKYGVQYPKMYATEDSPEAKAFNCVQRGHQNSLEGLPTFYALLLVSAVQFPLTAAVSGFVYSLGKIAYFTGYSTGDPDKRLRGSFSYFGLLTLIGCAVRTGFTLALA
ncbi:hypothetical protein CYMTET_13484 [Cymbomonas tetramitiformis]|uniref:Glutathione S-transferase 3, mitochondrial n=1 Tax=Cymbomonas tetramitiformis TaxID=36881 RepID=A0AAE0GIJ2_9CHLO|nr:hypothetical protein CYMTET_13484 [Cymbomonas tetramitiformis]